MPGTKTSYWGRPHRKLMKRGCWGRCIVLAMTLVVLGPRAESQKGEEPVIEQQIAELMGQMDQLDEDGRMRLLSRTDEQRSVLLGVLLKRIGTSDSKSVQAAAIYLIGANRLEQGAYDLIQRIDFDMGERRSPVTREPLWERYPAMEALIKIGQRGVQQALELLAKEDQPLRRDLAIKVMRYSTDADVATLILQRAHSQEADPRRKARLKGALSRLEAMLKDPGERA